MKKKRCECGETRQSQFFPKSGICRKCHNYRQANPEWREFALVKHLMDLEKQFWKPAL